MWVWFSIRSLLEVNFYTQLPVRARKFVRYPEFGGYPLLGGSLCTKYMASSIRAIGSVRYIEVVRSSEGPLSEVPLYTVGAGF